MAIDKSHPFQMRASPAWLQTIDQWRRLQNDLPSRAEAIRRLVEIGLNPPPSAPPHPQPDAAQTDRHAADNSALPDDLAEKLQEYRQSRPWLGDDNDALIELARLALQFSDERDDVIEIDPDTFARLHGIANGAHIAPIVRRYIQMGIDTAMAARRAAEEERDAAQGYSQ